jgi:alpha-galactosidase
MMTLWCIFRSPLIFGGDLPTNDAATTAFITNDEVLAVDQHSIHNHQSLEEGNIRAWVADVPDGNDHYVAVFNLGDKSEYLKLPWNKLGVNASSDEVRDLWMKSSLGNKNGVQVELRPHASVLYRVSPAQN